jgi:hypothetical protein
MAEGDGYMYSRFKESVMRMGEAIGSVGITVEEATEAMRGFGEAYLVGETGQEMIEVTCLGDTERSFIPAYPTAYPTVETPGCAHCGGHSTRRNLRNGLDCSGCGAPQPEPSGWPEPAQDMTIPR